MIGADNVSKHLLRRDPSIFEFDIETWVTSNPFLEDSAVLVDPLCSIQHPPNIHLLHPPNTQTEGLRLNLGLCVLFAFKEAQTKATQFWGSRFRQP